MIAYVDGNIEYLDLDCVVLDVSGVGINVRISESTATKLPRVGERIRLFTYTCVREDAFLLYGFLTRNDLDIFKKCITVNGIGPKGALSILSVMDANELRYAILSGDKKAISKAPGIGARTAERLILELKDKLSFDDNMIQKEVDATENGSVLDSEQKAEAIQALVSLGYGQSESMKAVNQIENIEELDSSQILKKALKFIY